jgi:hypothetical protein
MNYLKNTLTIPKVKDLVNTQNYNSIYKTINSANKLNDLNESNGLNEFNGTNGLNEFNETNMKTELKNFFKKQLKEDTTFGNNFH